MAPASFQIPQLTTNNDPDAGSYSTYVVALTVMSALVGASWPYLRSRYPCVTILELTAKEKSLDEVWSNASVEGCLNGSILATMTQRRTERVFLDLVLKTEASEIRIKALNMDDAPSLWRIYLGLHPSLVPEIVAWYKQADALERELQIKIELHSQGQLQSNPWNSAQSSSLSSITPPPPTYPPSHVHTRHHNQGL
ncbi:40S ribosomal protein S6 [Paramarasmius palmivorus]|uniref:40S ribosomal protein S6 n=1 Tax=Paramarasmius palmivorus TaxID=297713 RepID=A0AAW0CR24_9AGAR